MAFRLKTSLNRSEKKAFVDSNKSLENVNISSSTLRSILGYMSSLIERVRPTYYRAIRVVEVADEDRRHANARRDQEMETFRTMAIHFDSVFAYRLKRLEEQALLQRIRLDGKGAPIQATPPEELFEMGRKMLEGEQRMIEDGYEPMVNPSAAELKAAYNQAMAAYEKAEKCGRIAREARENMRKQDGEVSNLSRIYGATLQVALGDHEAATRREILRSLGFKVVRVNPTTGVEEEDDGQVIPETVERNRLSPPAGAAHQVTNLEGGEATA